jgi:hypothetical protein
MPQDTDFHFFITGFGGSYKYDLAAYGLGQFFSITALAASGTANK